MGSGTLKLIVVAALAVIGLVVLIQAFPTIPAPTTPVATSNPQKERHHHKKKPTPTPSPTPTPKATPKAGLEVAVFNGTTQSLLGAVAADDLTKAGYVVPKPFPQNAPTQTVATTTIYFRDARDQTDAQDLADSSVFKGIHPDVTQLPSSVTGVPKSVPLAVFLGTDYAAQNHQ